MDTEVVYTSPKRVQIWFLNRSRRAWKENAMELTVERKRLRNRIADLEASREKWKSAAQTARSQARELEAKVAALEKRLEGEKRRRS